LGLFEQTPRNPHLFADGSDGAPRKKILQSHGAALFREKSCIREARFQSKKEFKRG